MHRIQRGLDPPGDDAARYSPARETGPNDFGNATSRSLLYGVHLRNREVADE
jgi:hypothetical protein